MKRILIIAAILSLVIGCPLMIRYFSPHPILLDPDHATLVSFIYQGQEMADQMEKIDSNYLLQLLSRYECKRKLHSTTPEHSADYEFVLQIKPKTGLPISILVSRLNDCLMVDEVSICEIIYGEYLHEKLIRLIQQQSS